MGRCYRAGNWTLEGLQQIEGREPAEPLRNQGEGSKGYGAKPHAEPAEAQRERYRSAKEAGREARAAPAPCRRIALDPNHQYQNGEGVKSSGEAKHFDDHLVLHRCWLANGFACETRFASR